MNELQIWICEENIQRFRAQLDKVRDDDRRRVIIKLLEEEQGMLRQFTHERGVNHIDPPSQAQSETGGGVSTGSYLVSESSGFFGNFFDI